jgi:hypothetical protein
MMDVWFSPQTALWFSLLSLLSVTAALSEFAKRGRYRSGVIAVYRIVFGFGIALLVAGFTAVLFHQPWYVVFPLGWSGMVIAPATTWAIVATNREYRNAEMRHTIAQDL